MPTDKAANRQHILLKSKGMEVDRREVAHFINDYFINVGNALTSRVSDGTKALIAAPLSDSANSSLGAGDRCSNLDYNSDNNSSYDDPEKTGPDLWGFGRISQSDVYKVIKAINVSKSSGLEHISSFIVKEAFGFLVPEMTFLYNLSLTSSKFPRAWRKALLISIPKSRNLTEFKNYRPISLLLLPGKILEKLVHAQLLAYLEDESFLASEEKHGFRKNHSTVHSVAQLTNYIHQKMDSKLPTLVTYIDFRKALDCVQHPTLINKLTGLHLNSQVTDWVES